MKFKNYIKDNNITLENYESLDMLLNELNNGEKISFILVPLDENMSTILSSEFKIYKN